MAKSRNNRKNRQSRYCKDCRRKLYKNYRLQIFYKNIDLNEVEAGLQLQLLTYVDAICKRKKTEPAGALYFSLIEPIIKSSEVNRRTDRRRNKKTI